MAYMNPIAGRWALTATLCGAGWVSSVGVAAPVDPVESIRSGAAIRVDYVEAELIAREPALVPGQTARLGLRLKMDEHWHTYWKNPGDSGLETSIEWKLPGGYTPGPILWPAPSYFEVGGLAGYGYEGHVVLPVDVSVPADAAAGSRIDLRASVDWLVCREQCLPGAADLRLELPVVASDDRVQPDPRWAELFAQAEARSPRLLPAEASVSALAGAGAVELEVAGLGRPTGAATPPEARFFPDTAVQIQMAGPQAPRWEDGVLRLELSASAIDSVPERLSGVLVVQEPDGVRVFPIQTKVRRVADRP